MNDSPPAGPHAPFSNRWIWALVLGLLGWAVFLAVGSYLGGGKLAHDPRHGLNRGLTVFGMMALFIICWMALLLTRKPRTPRP